MQDLALLLESWNVDIKHDGVRNVFALTIEAQPHVWPDEPARARYTYVGPHLNDLVARAVAGERSDR